MSFSTPTYGDGDYNSIFLIFIVVWFQNVWAPERNGSKTFYFQKSAIPCCNNFVTCSVKSCGRINACCECNMLGWSGDLQSRITIDYSKKPSSTVTTHCDKENQVFLTTNCNRLQGPFTSPQSLSISGSSGVALGETKRSQRFVLRHKVANTPLITPMVIDRACSSQLF